MKAAQLPRIRIHDRRHTHVTLALQAGANVRAVSERVDHRDISIRLGTYAHVLPAQHVEVAAKVGAVLFAPWPGWDPHVSGNRAGRRCAGRACVTAFDMAETFCLA